MQHNMASISLRQAKQGNTSEQQDSGDGHDRAPVYLRLMPRLQFRGAAFLADTIVNVVYWREKAPA